MNRIECIFDAVVKNASYRVKDLGSVRSALEKCEPRGKSILEVGCGIGDNLLYCICKGARYAEGFDISGESIMIARSKAAGNDAVLFHKCSLEEYSTDRKFDIILALGVFEYFQDPFCALKKMVTFLAESGVLVLYISRPILIKRIAVVGRLMLAHLPSKFAIPVARFLSRVVRLLPGKIAGKLYAGESSTYTLEQTIMEGLMVPRYNIFDQKLFSDYLIGIGFSVDIIDSMVPSMTCMIAKRRFTQ